MVARGYAQAYRATSVLTASPGQLVLMLFDGALKSLAIAQDAFGRPSTDRTRIETINRHLLKAQSILAELQGGLNMEVGGEFAQTMHSLYDYHMRRLFEANVRKQVGPVIEVERLLREVRDAWAEMLSRRDVTVGEGSRVA
jgi:flagellar secretion chaperone FliS